MTGKQYTALLLALILVLGLLLRYHDLDTESIWTDEAVTLREAGKNNLSAVISEVIIMEVFPPGYPIFMHYWVSVFGNSEFSVRMPSLIFSFVSIFILFLIASRLLGKYGGLLATFFISTGMLQIVFSQEARLYSLFGFLALLSTYALINFIKLQEIKNFQKRVWLGVYTITIIISAYVNYLTVFLVIFQLLGLLYSNKKNVMKKFMPSLIIVSLFSLPLIPIIIKQFTIHNTRWITTLISYGTPRFISNIGLFLFALPMVGLTILLVLLFTIRNLLKSIRIGQREKIVIATIFLIITVAYIFSLDTIMRSFVLIRHSYFLVPVLYVALAKFITIFSKKRKVQIFIITLIILFNLTTVSLYYQNMTKPDWKSTSNFISGETTGVPSIIFVRTGSNVEIFEYYYGDKFKNINTPLDTAGKIDRATLLEMLSNESEFWLIASSDKGSGKIIRDTVEEKYFLDIEKNFVEIELYHYTGKGLNKV